MDKKESAKERILRVASDLFYREGVRAVGIDRIIQESGVAKASFYRNFATKDDLVIAYLEQHQCTDLHRVEEAQQRYPDSPLDQLLYLLDETVKRIKRKGFRGCPFMNTIVEFPDLEHPGHKQAVAWRKELWDKVTEIAVQAGAQNPRQLTEQLRMLVNGAAMMSSIDNASFQEESFFSAVRLLIDRQLGAGKNEADA